MASCTNCYCRCHVSQSNWQCNQLHYYRFDAQLTTKFFDVYQFYFNVTVTFQECTIRNIGEYFIYSKYQWAFTNLGYFFSIMASKIMLLALSFDRFLAVFSPMSYLKRCHYSFACEAGFVAFVVLVYIFINTIPS